MFKLGDLFEIEGTKCLDRNAIDFIDEGINFISRTNDNNGIQGKIAERSFLPNLSNTITATVIGNYKYVKYQTEPYYCSQNINKLTPKKIIDKWNKNVAYFFVSNIQKFISLYDGQQGGYKLNEIKNYYIKLPTKYGKIDFDFMENFIAELEAYLLATELKDYQLTKEEQVLDDFSDLEFSAFDIPNIFDVKNTGNILSRDIVAKSGSSTYLCASADNNAVSTYISYNEKYLDTGNCVFIGVKTFVVTYQESDFYSNDSHNLVLYLRDEERNKLNQLYLATCVTKSLSHKYSWGYSVSYRKIQKDKLSHSI